MDGVGQSGSSNPMDEIMKYVEMAMAPLKLVEGILKSITGGGGDTVSQSQAQGGPSGGATTEHYAPAPWPGYMQGKEKKADEEMAKTLELVEANFDLFDSGNGKAGKDGKVGMFELSMVANDPSLPKEVRDAARRILESPWLMDRLDGGQQGGARDGNFDLAAVKWLRGSVEQSARLNGPAQTTEPGPAEAPAQAAPRPQGPPDARVQQSGAPPAQALDTPDPSALSEGGGPTVAQSESALGSVLDDPTVGFEAKTNLVLAEAMQASEDEAIDIYRQYEASIAAQEDSSLSEKDRAAAEKREARLQIKLQRAMQKRQEMFQLLTNMMDMSHDMSMAAIRNMKD